LFSAAAEFHGVNRRTQDYSASMLVEESRILQVSSVNALQNNLANIKFSALLYQVMTIADEVDSQLMQTMDCHVMESTIHAAGVRVGGVNEPATFLDSGSRPSVPERCAGSWKQ
jgi:hypothetical protein